MCYRRPSDPVADKMKITTTKLANLRCNEDWTTTNVMYDEMKTGRRWT